MNTGSEKPKITEVTMKVVELLLPLDSEARQRVMQASFLLLGETHVSPHPNPPVSSPDVSGQGDGPDTLSKQGKIWMKQYNVTLQQLENIFHFSNGHAEVIAAEMYGKDTKARTLNAYILMGLSRLLTSGDSTFDDKSARALCRHSGCYSEANHAFYLKAKGNTITGSKDTGWKLTAPGLKYSSDLIKQMSE
jgi:hypothetical protein